MKKSRWVLSLIDSWWLKEPSFLTPLLMPWSIVFMIVVVIRRWCYRVGIKESTSFNVPIIVIGNIVVGGTGKTPLLIALAQLLKENGFNPGIVSRGYGANKIEFPIEVFPGSNVVEVGDEPLLIATQTKFPLVISPDRVAAVKTLLEKHHCDIVLSDDGMQHYALERDLEIAVIDGERSFGNGFALPAGPLREPISRLKSVKWIVCNGKSLNKNFRFYSKSIVMRLKPKKIRSIIDDKVELETSAFSEQKIHAIAGIGNPKRFFDLLQELGLKLIKHSFPDHYRFKRKDIDVGATSKVIMTEKDAVKCRDIADKRHFYLPVEADLPAEFKEAFLKQVRLIKKGERGEG